MCLFLQDQNYKNVPIYNSQQFLSKMNTTVALNSNTIYTLSLKLWLWGRFSINKDFIIALFLVVHS